MEVILLHRMYCDYVCAFVHFECCTINRGDHTYEEAESTELVPGDVIEVPQYGCVMQCDAVLITGKNYCKRVYVNGLAVIIKINDV